MLIRISLSAAELNVLQDNNCLGCCPTASCTRILEAFKRCSFITHFSFASLFLPPIHSLSLSRCCTSRAKLICENKLSSQMSSVFFPQGSSKRFFGSRWQGDIGRGVEVRGERKWHSICTRMFGHMECRFRGGLFSFISQSIKHHLLCHFTHSHVSN